MSARPCPVRCTVTPPKVLALAMSDGHRRNPMTRARKGSGFATMMERELSHVDVPLRGVGGFRSVLVWSVGV